MKATFFFLKSSQIKRQFTCFLAFLSGVFCPSAFPVLFENWTETGTVYLLDISSIENDEEHPDKKKISFSYQSDNTKWSKSSNESNESNEFSNIQRFMAPQDEEDHHHFESIDGALENCQFSACCPSSTQGNNLEIDFVSKNKDSYKTRECLNDISASSCTKTNKTLLDAPGESIELLMGADCSFYAVIRGLDHPYNSYTFEKMISTLGKSYDIGQTVLCHRPFWTKDVISCDQNTNVTEDFDTYIKNNFCDRPSGPQKKYDCFVFKLKLKDEDTNEIRDNLNDNRNALISSSTMTLILKQTDRRRAFIQAGNNVQKREQRGYKYAWTYGSYASSDERIQGNDIFVFNRDLFCQEYIHIPAIINMKHKVLKNASEKYPVHFYIKYFDNSKKELLVDVYIEPCGDNSPVQTMGTVQACLKTTIINSSDENIEGANSDTQDSFDNYQNGHLIKEAYEEGEKLHYAFRISPNLVKHIKQNSSIGFSFNWHEDSKNTWKIHAEDEATGKWELSGGTLPGYRLTEFPVDWSGIVEHHTHFSSDEAYGKMKTDTKLCTGSMKFVISEDDTNHDQTSKTHNLKCLASLSDNDKSGNVVTAVCLSVRNVEGNDAPAKKSMVTRLLSMKLAEKSKKQPKSNSNSNSNSKTNVNIEHKRIWCKSNSLDQTPLFLDHLSQNDVSRGYMKVRIATVAMSIEEEQSKTTCLLGTASKTRTVTSQKLLLINPERINGEVLKQLPSGTIQMAFTRIGEHEVVTANFNSLQKDVINVSMHNNNGIFTTGSPEKNTGSITLSIPHTSNNNMYFATIQSERISVDAKELATQKAVELQSNALSLQGKKVTNTQRQEMTEKIMGGTVGPQTGKKTLFKDPEEKIESKTWWPRMFGSSTPKAIQSSSDHE
ncbi:MAG: hypothetical protein QS721_01105 [Candidatus Endonucleobacter sp. (ex Gigantidas childressi)]|nr:hypothetical protein [Candidatus Endonucleobacter sp. (ex Gigantidas childressi)]